MGAGGGGELAEKGRGDVQCIIRLSHLSGTEGFEGSVCPPPFRRNPEDYCKGRFFPPDPLTISDLFHVNESLTSIEHVWKELGAALGLKQATLEKIRSRYLQQIDCCFTEVLAAWLNEEDRPHDSPGHPNWEEVTTALKSPTVGDGDLAQSIMETIASEFHFMVTIMVFSKVEIIANWR